MLRVRLRGGSVQAVVEAWRAPCLRLRLPGRSYQYIRPRQAAATLLLTPDAFFDPMEFYDDFSLVHPGTCQGWSRALVEYMRSYGAELPSGWLNKHHPLIRLLGARAAQRRHQGRVAR